MKSRDTGSSWYKKYGIHFKIVLYIRPRPDFKAIE